MAGVVGSQQEDVLSPVPHSSKLVTSLSIAYKWKKYGDSMTHNIVPKYIDLKGCQNI